MLMMSQLPMIINLFQMLVNNPHWNDADGYLTVTIKNDVFDAAPEFSDFNSQMSVEMEIKLSL